MIGKCLILLSALWAVTGAPAIADGTPASDPVAQALIAPEVVMAHQDAIGLSDAQKKNIESDVQSAQQRFTSLQWQLSAATEKLVGALNATHVEKDQALTDLDGVLALERELKHTQLTLMIQIKNELTADQQARARRFAGETSK